MSYDELINAIERDALRERQKILEDAMIEADNLIEGAKRELKKIKGERLAELRHSFERERTRAVSSAKRDAKALSLLAKDEIISEVFRETEKKVTEIKKGKGYPYILIKLFKEVAEKGRMELDSGEFEVCVSEDDMDILKREMQDGVKLKPDRDIKEGVILASSDGRIRLVNTMKSRIERVKADMLPILDHVLFS